MPLAVLSATNFDGASTAEVIVPLEADSVGVADTSAVADGSLDAEVVGIGAASSFFEDDCDQTTNARSAIPTITAITTRLDAPCCGFATAAEATGRTGATGATARGAADVTGTAGTLTDAVEVRLAAAFLTTRLFGAAFLATAFFATAFLATFLTAAFLTGFLATAFLIVFLAAGFFAALFFLATAFFATGFLAATFLAGAFFVAFLATLFFTATFTPWVAVRAQVTHSDKPRLS